MFDKYFDSFSINQQIKTKDGLGKILGRNKRMNTNGGPGTTQFRVELNDGRIRHYKRSEIAHLNS